MPVASPRLGRPRAFERPLARTPRDSRRREPGASSLQGRGSRARPGRRRVPPPPPSDSEVHRRGAQGGLREDGAGCAQADVFPPKTRTAAPADQEKGCHAQGGRARRTELTIDSDGRRDQADIPGRHGRPAWQAGREPDGKRGGVARAGPPARAGMASPATEWALTAGSCSGPLGRAGGRQGGRDSRDLREREGGVLLCHAVRPQLQREGGLGMPGFTHKRRRRRRRSEPE